jgi:hypothetical protein
MEIEGGTIWKRKRTDRKDGREQQKVIEVNLIKIHDVHV